MTNAEIAEVFSKIAGLLEIKGESVFKVRAYEKAAQTIAALTEDLADLRRVGELRRLPGIGESTAEKIGELLDTGQCAHLEELLREFPPDLLEMLEIPELGPKKIKGLYETLGIGCVRELEAAAVDGKLRELKGFGKKTEENILKNIERWRRFSARTPLARAYPMAEAIVAALKKRAPVEEIQVAGSLRRMRDTVGDLDILTTSEKPMEVIKAFLKLPQVREISEKGETKASVITTGDLQADLRVVSPEAFGAALLYFTGSKEHNVKLRELALKQQMRINEYGISDLATDKRLGGATEEEMYAALKLPWMPPEIREDRGEIEAAQQHKLPHLVEEKDIRGDLHIHSDWSDGTASIPELAREALRRGYEYIAICDHSPAQAIARGLEIERLQQRNREIEKFRKQFSELTILAGMEVDIRADGAMDYPDEILAELDFVIASLHTGWRASEEANTERILKAIANPWVDVIGHPTGRLIGQREPYEVDLEKVFAAAAAAGVALEIDAHPERLDLKDTHARRAKEVGAKLVIDTDAHRLDNLQLMRFGVATARRAWLEPKDILNCLPATKFLAALRPRPGEKSRLRQTTT
jgi:DNA polymerase (family 10)